jgi:hypothetical protein
MNMAEGSSFFRAKYTLYATTGGVSRVRCGRTGPVAKISRDDQLFGERLIN